MFVENGHVREEVERLEDDPDPAAHRVHVDARSRDLLAAHDDSSCVDRLEQIHAAQERRLARARRADEADDLVLGQLEVDPAQHLELPEGLAQSRDLQRRRAHAALPACWRRLSRATSQSVKRAMGIVSAMKMIAVAM